MPQTAVCPMTKSPMALARAALDIAGRALTRYSSRYSRQDFTQHQLFAILVLRQFFRTDYRGIVEILNDFGELREALELKKIPHYSTLCYAHQRLLKKGDSTDFNEPFSVGLASLSSSENIRKESSTPQGWKPATSVATTSGEPDTDVSDGVGGLN